MTPGAVTEVWAVTNKWSDTDTRAAREAGLAWEANSGLDWEAKYQRFIASLQKVARDDGNSGSTFRITTPYGDRAFDAPRLQCAEVALLLRAAFASWYHLPFFLQGFNPEAGGTIFAGNFGFVDAHGRRVARFPQFRIVYQDHEGRWSPGQPWPHDSQLRGYRLGDDDDDSFLPDASAGAHTGAYLDEMFLNKRVGYFMRLVLLYFGSENLADPNNLFQLAPEAISPGDVQLERIAQHGIGHTIAVMRVDSPEPRRFEVSVASGSMPARATVWDSPLTSASDFT